ncbi:hypothetical protein AMJ57_00395 [Parcubacteria bacterium SG8_24]|nr:MAG: hypothetical protein AMJ57_00395 [Parcubacteria bacterium SG8_24]
MDPMILKLLVIAAVSLAGFVLVTVLTKAALFRGVANGIRYLRFRIRLWRDPALKRRFEIVGQYEGLFLALVHVRALNRRLHDGEPRDRDGRPVPAGLVERHQEQTSSAFAELKKRCVDLLDSLDEEGIEAVAEFLAGQLAGLSPDVREVQAFLESEQRLVRRQPSLVVGHVERLVKRFAKGPEAGPDGPAD